MAVALTRLARIYRAAARRAPFSGVLTLVDTRSGALIFSRTSGWANRAEGIRNRLDTRFASASGSKLFTALAVLQLVEAGQLSLDAPAAALLEDFPFGMAITVRHLLSHTSGLPDYFDEDGPENSDYGALWTDKPVYGLNSASDFSEMYYNKPPVFRPGERFGYNNAGFLLLERIVETVSGEPFRERVRRRVFEPAGMASAGYFYTDRLPPRCALGYLGPELDARANLFAVPYIGGGDGGAYASASDWAMFWAALLEERLLGQPLLAEMFTPHAPGPGLPGRPGRQYGLGVWLNTAPLRQAVRAVGSDPGVEMVSAALTTAGLCLTVLSNQNDGAGELFWELLSAL